MSATRRDQVARERCEAELSALRAREKAATASELPEIIERKAELKQMRKVGIYYEQQRPALGGFSLPWSKPQEEGEAGPGGLRGFKLPQFPPMPKLPTADDLPFQLPTGLDVELVAGTASFGTVTGFCSGVALKKIGRAAAAVTGVLFMGLTAAERSGYIEVKWDKVKDSTIGRLDTNVDGELTHEDAQVYFRKLVDYMTDQNTALTATSYATGLVLGLRLG